MKTVGLGLLSIYGKIPGVGCNAGRGCYVDPRDKERLEFLLSLNPEGGFPQFRDSEEWMRPYVIGSFLTKGALPRNTLQDGVEYYGDCRNSSTAIWDASKRIFRYMRYKFGESYPEEINHFQDDDGYDVFVPMGIRETDKN